GVDRRRRHPAVHRRGRCEHRAVRRLRGRADRDGGDPGGVRGRRRLGRRGDLTMTAPQDPATVADSADRVTDAAEAAPAPPLWRQGAVALLAIAVIAALLSSPWSSGFAFFYLGVVPGIIALRLNWRIAAGSAVATAVAVLIGVWVSGSTAGAVIWLTLLALTIGYAARFGLATIASMITVQAAIVAISGN